MNPIRKPLLGLAAVLLAASATMAQAQVRITEISPWSSGNSPYAADWFELTNLGASALDISGWKMDDSSASFAAAVSLMGITRIGAGQSVIFMEGSSPANNGHFISEWFGANVPVGFAMGNYSGSGVGLGTGGDGVNIFNAAGILQASVSFGASTSGQKQTFDNAVGLNGVAVSQLSMVGTNGAFISLTAGEIGSPGAIAAAVPEPETYAMLLAGLGVVGAIARRRRQA